MNSYIRYFVLAIVIASNGSIVCGQAHRQTLKIQAPDALNFINADGKPLSYYELHLINFSTDTLKLKKLSILNVGDSSICSISQKQDLQNRYRKIGSAKIDTSMWLAPGSSAVIYIELTLQKKRIREIAHHISFEIVGEEHLGEFSNQTPITKCLFTTQLVLGSPLQSGAWTAVYDPSWERGHRRVIYTLNGTARIPGRYAIDFIKMHSNGKYATVDENIIRNWYGYEVDVLAVADGIVASTRDDFSESKTLSEHTEYSADKATGNYVSIKIGESQFAFYEHLKPKSIKVKVGQKIKKGEVIASLGFTGQTTGPHLHFHLANADSPLGAEGIPFVFESFEVLGSYPDFGSFGKTAWTPLNDSKKLIRKQERPSSNSVIKFGEK
jgi:murein DD-endopeptidase